MYFISSHAAYACLVHTCGTHCFVMSISNERTVEYVFFPKVISFGRLKFFVCLVLNITKL